MGADLMVDEACAAKTTLGQGDPHIGGEVLVRLVKARNQARAALEAQPGADPAAIAIQIVVGSATEEITAAALLDRAAPLDAVASHCTPCPANLLGQAFGCIGYVAYPIPAATEATLLQRLEPADRFGGHLALRAIADFGYDGAPIAEWRTRGLFEARTATSRPMGGIEVTTDILFQGILAVGDRLQPAHCALILVWFGALSLDGEVPPDVDAKHLTILEEMVDPEQRAQRSGLVATGDPVADRLLAFLHAAYVRGVPLRTDA